MKRLLIILFLSVSTIVTAQQSVSSRLKIRISDDGQILSIRIDGNKNSRKIHYHQTFNVTGINSLQKEWLKYRAFALQGLALPLQEMTGLILTAVGLLAGMLTLFIVRFQYSKAARISLMKSLRSN